MRGSEELESEMSALMEVVALQKPLVENAVLVRRRLFVQAKKQRGHGEAIDSIIRAGNRAAHRGDWFADLAMFKLDYMKAPELFAEPTGIETTFERIYMGVFDDIYGYPVDNLWQEFLRQDRISSKQVEFYTICASMAVSAPIVVDSSGGHAEFAPFEGHVAAVTQAWLKLANVHKNLSHLKTAVDADREMEANLKAMREIVENIVRRGPEYRRSWKIEGRERYPRSLF